MVAVAEDDERRSGRPGHLDRPVRGDAARMVPPAVSRVVANESRPFHLRDRPGGRVHDAGRDERQVVRQTSRAVRRDPAPIGGDEDLGDIGRDVVGRADGTNERRRPGPEEVGSDGDAVSRVGQDRHRRGAFRLVRP